MRQLIFITSFVLLSACGGSGEDTDFSANFVMAPLPETVVAPENNPTTPEKVELGKMLFWDPVMSGDFDVACATCHHPDAGYGDDLDVSIGVGGVGLAKRRVPGTFAMRNAPTILNTAFNGIDVMSQYNPLSAPMFWDNRMNSLEEQAIGPIHSPEEMKGENYTDEEILPEVIRRLSELEGYQQLFTAAFGDADVTEQRIAQSIAAFERTLVNNNTPFDRYARGDDTALTAQQVEGMEIFAREGCANCHNGPMFSDFELHELPVPTNNKQPNDRGVEGKFRTPSLRNLAHTAPYMHNGTKATLEEAISFYHNIDNPSNDPDLNGVNISDSNTTIAAVKAFLLSLSDDNFDKTVPESVPSGLNPGGDI